MQTNVTSNDAGQLLDTLEIELARLAARWRGTDDPETATMLVAQYQRTLLAMILLGYHQWLDVESELPERYMPAEYVSGEFLKNTSGIQLELTAARYAQLVAEELHTPLIAIQYSSQRLVITGKLKRNEFQEILANITRIQMKLNELAHSRKTEAEQSDLSDESENKTTLS